MISEKLQNAINDQINAEMWSSNLYLSMSFYLQSEGFDGFASWMRKQSQEELQHAYDLADYLVEVFEHVYKHECHVSELIDELVNVASGEKDKASQDFLWGYVREQVEEEATAQGIVEKLRKCGDGAGILYLDEQLGKSRA